jgi:hypothetical protein
MQTDAQAQWRKRVLLVGGGLQVAFGAWWLVRALSPITSPLVAGLFGALVVLGAITVTPSLLSSAPRPRGPEALRIERRLSVATILQLVASFLVTWGLSQLQAQRLSLPFVMASIGALLIWTHREVKSPFQGTAGRALIGLSLLALAWAGTGQMVFAGLSSAAVLLGCAGAGYHWLEHHELDD